jgi:hypothetical protein
MRNVKPNLDKREAVPAFLLQHEHVLWRQRSHQLWCSGPEVQDLLRIDAFLQSRVLAAWSVCENKINERPLALPFGVVERLVLESFET